MQENGTQTTPPLPTILTHMNTAYSLVGAIGIVGNGFVVFVICRSPRLRGMTHFFILNQSVVDLSSSLLFLVLKLGKSIPSGGVLGDIFCKFWYSNFFMWSLFLTSTANLAAVTIERYVAICRPIFHRSWVTKKKVKYIIIAEWFLGIPIELLWGLPFKHSGTECIRNTSYMYGVVTGCVFFLVAWFLPLILMAYCYLRIWVSLRKNKVAPITGESGESAGSGGSSHLRRAQKNVVKTLLTVGVTYALCWGPNQLSLLYFNLGGHINFLGYFHNISILLVFCNMCVNPFIYAFQYEQFRNSIRQAFWCQSQLLDAGDGNSANSATGVTGDSRITNV
ncbi:allatostatin-A receptor-like [Ptychodera flava]|uniref:allatostatin-A receptor-like n=1 Tax=Ptychodera flava TaxID=63121 RepID=UPI00396A757C